MVLCTSVFRIELIIMILCTSVFKIELIIMMKKYIPFPKKMTRQFQIIVRRISCFHALEFSLCFNAGARLNRQKLPPTAPVSPIH